MGNARYSDYSKVVIVASKIALLSALLLFYRYYAFAWDGFNIFRKQRPDNTKTTVSRQAKKPADASVRNFSKKESQQPLPTVGPAVAEETISKKKDLPLDIKIPEGIGHITEGYRGKDGDKKVIIHIQDIHTNYEAQKNLSHILEVLINDNKLKLIMVEGGWGDVSLSYLRSYAGKERRLEVAEEYLKAGKISGEEYLNIKSDYDMVIEGLEDENLYKINLDTFFEIEKFREKASEELASIKTAIGALKEKLYPAQLQELEKAGKDYADGKMSLADYYKQINTLAAKAKISLSAFPNFDNFIKITTAEKQISFPSVEKERAALIEKLSKKLSKDKLTTLVTKSLEFRLNKLTPAEYHNYLIKQAEDAGETIDHCPNLKKYIDYINSHESINTTKLFEEADGLTSQAKGILITDERQKKLDGISRAEDILENFLGLKLVPNDFNYYKEHKNDFITATWVDFINGEIRRNKMKAPPVKVANTIDKNLSTLAKFYDIANERDDMFVKNSIRLMNEHNQPLAVIISGGFHTPTLLQKLRECGMSYIVIAPHTSQQTDSNLYRYILKYKSGREE